MLCLLSLFALLLFHPLHLSVTEIEHNEKNRALQITSRIFIDDIEASIRRDLQKPTLDLLNPQNNFTTEELVWNYLSDHLRLQLDDKHCEVTFLGYEIEDFSLVCYLEVQHVRAFKSIEVSNTVMMEIYEDQSNLVHVTYEGLVKSVRLNRGNTSKVFMF